MRLVYTDVASEDIEMAFHWYERQQKGLGSIFLDSLEQGIVSIIDFPETPSVTHRQFYRKLIKKFPFSIFYTLEENKIVVHAVFDNRQDPQKKPE